MCENKSIGQIKVTDTGDVDVKLLEAFYFNKVSCVTIITDTESYDDVITDDTLWKASQSGLEEYCRKEYDIPADEELHIYQADGYIQTINWKKSMLILLFNKALFGESFFYAPI